MGLSSLQVCIDSSDWLQVLGHDEETEMESSWLNGDMMTCSRPMMERRIRLLQDQAIECPRCNSTHTKFCYYNNYSLSQPRYFCKTCRRYWTKGGSLRNIPVGGGCRKNKRVVNKKSNDDQHRRQSISSRNAADLHLSLSDVQRSHVPTVFNTSSVIGNTRSHDFMVHGLCSPYGLPLDENNGGQIVDSNEGSNAVEMKPDNKLLSLERQEHGFSYVDRESIGYLDCLGPWPSLINGYGCAATNSLI